METKFRTERDQLGEAAIPVGALHGIHTARAIANFGLAGRPADMLAAKCVDGIRADEERCRSLVRSATATATALIARLGYEKVAALVGKAELGNSAVRDICIHEGLLSGEEFDALISPEAVCSLGYRGEVR